MKTIIRSNVVILSLLYCGIIYGQNEHIKLRCSDYIIGLNNVDFLRERLSESGFTLLESGGESYELWQETIYRVEFTTNKRISVSINKAYTGLPERLFEEIKQSFQCTKTDEECDTATLNGEHFYRKVYYQTYSRDIDNVKVNVSYHGGQYHFTFLK